MKKYLFIFSAFILMSFSNWQTDFTTAKQLANEQNKLVLLNFSGSDWCGPCIMFRKQVLEDESFKQFADMHLILINADFPRQKKNQLSKEQQKANGLLADKYNKKGLFPLTVLLNADGKILKTWEGKPKEETTGFIDEIRNFIVK